MGTGEASRHELRLVTTGLREILTKYFAQQMHTNKFIEYIESYFIIYIIYNYNIYNELI